MIAETKFCRLLASALCGCAAATMLPVIDDMTVSIQLKMTACQESAPDFLACALNSGLDSRNGYSQLCRQFRLSQALIFRQDESLPIGLGQRFDHIPQGKTLDCLSLLGHTCGWNLLRDLSRFGAAPVMVNDNVPGDLINPTFNSVRVHQPLDAAVDAQENLLQKVLGGSVIFDALPNETKQSVTEAVPYGFRIVHTSY